MNSRLLASSATAALLLGLGFAMPARAQTAAPAAPAAPTSNAMAVPTMNGPIAANPNPISFDLGPWLGKTYVTGVVTGLGFGQTNTVPYGNPPNRSWEADLSNGMVDIQKTDGVFQYFISAGVYSIPVLGVPYTDASHTNSELFGPVPMAFAKIAPTDNFSVEVGKLPTLIGEELTFTYENLNIERGLLWNQENIVNRGIQANYTAGPVAFAVSWNDGFYSNRFSYLTGSATWTVTSADTIILAGGGNMATDSVTTYAAAGVFQNEQQVDLSYTHTMGPWSINPYIQYTNVPADQALGTTTSGSTYGAALLVDYSFDSSDTLGGVSLAGVSVPFRIEYLGTSGSKTTGPNLLYGAGSNAWSLTVTPTYQYNIFFARLEASYVGASSVVAGDAFGSSGTDTSQFRGVLEAGFVF